VTCGEAPEGGVARNERPRRSGSTPTIQQRDQRRVSSVARTNAARFGLLAALFFSLGLLSACGGSSSTNTPSAPSRGAAAAAGEQAALRASIGVATPALLKNGSFAPQYTCKGGNVSLPLKWAGVNTATAKELVVLVRSYVTLRNSRYNWAVAGISPSVQRISAGTLPAGAIVGRNSFGQNGYNLCLVKGAPRMLVTVDVLALPHAANLKPGFDPAAMVEQVRNPGVGWGSVIGYLGA
jgi:phosphatidylethanolamine-binding protein (PEBP) family uncharacterized protein